MYSKTYSLAALLALTCLHGAVALDPITDDAKEWAKKGSQRWEDITKALEDKSGTDEGPSDFCQTRNPRYWLDGVDSQATKPSGRYEDFIKAAKLDISTDANNYEIKIGFPWNGEPGRRNIPTVEDDNALRYDNYYNPKDNIIVASDLWKGRKNKDLEPFSKVTWTMWDQVKGRDGGKAGDLKALVHYTCANDGAKEVAEWLCKDKGTNEYKPKSDEFNAVLGIDNGATAKGLVTQHKHALNFKTIKTITVVCDGSPLMGVSYNLG